MVGVCYTLGTFAGPVLAGDLDERFGYYVMNCILGMFLRIMAVTDVQVVLVLCLLPLPGSLFVQSSQALNPKYAKKPIQANLIQVFSPETIASCPQTGTFSFLFSSGKPVRLTSS